MKEITLKVDVQSMLEIDGMEVKDVLHKAADLAHEVLDELSLFRQQNGLDPDTFACEASCCEFLDIVGD